MTVYEFAEEPLDRCYKRGSILGIPFGHAARLDHSVRQPEQINLDRQHNQAGAPPKPAPAGT